jgi:hypothetical protein
MVPLLARGVELPLTVHAAMNGARWTASHLSPRQPSRLEAVVLALVSGQAII